MFTDFAFEQYCTLFEQTRFQCIHMHSNLISPLTTILHNHQGCFCVKVTVVKLTYSEVSNHTAKDKGGQK